MFNIEDSSKALKINNKITEKDIFTNIKFRKEELTMLTARNETKIRKGDRGKNKARTRKERDKKEITQKSCFEENKKPRKGLNQVTSPRINKAWKGKNEFCKEHIINVFERCWSVNQLILLIVGVHHIIVA